MKVAHAGDQQPTLVGLGDTQQIREIGPPTDERDAAAKQSKLDWLILGGIAIAVALAAAALGMGILSYVSSPNAVAGPQGATGLQGVNRASGSPRRAWTSRASRGNGAGGSEGGNRPYRPARSRGTTAPGRVGAGATGASGTIVASTTTSGTPVLSAIDPPVGTSVTATASCPHGEFALGGGAQVSAPGLSNKSVTLRSSYPTSTNGWRAVGSLIAPLGTGEQMTVRPYVLCGKASHN